MRDLFDENKNFNVIKTKNQLVLKGELKEDDGEETKKDEKNYPDANIEQMLRTIGLADCIPKLKENEVAEPEVFYELSEDTLITALDIKTEGKKYRFKQQLKEIKDKHTKNLAKKQDDIAEIVGETFEMLQRNASIIY